MGSTAEKRRALAALAADRDREGRTGRIVKRSLAALLVLLLGSLPALWALGFFSTPPAVAEVQQIVDQQVAEYDRVARGEMSFASAPSPWAAFGRMRDVPEQYREQAEREMGRLWAARERAETGSYFSLPAKERQAELDRRIKAEDERRQRWLAERGDRGPRGADGGGGRQEGGGRAQGGETGRTGGSGGGQRGGSEESRTAWAKRRIDRSTPEERAQRAEYRRAIEARRTQLGLPSGGGRRSG